MKLCLTTSVIACCCLQMLSLRAESTPESDTFFENHVRPILAQHCWECHGPKKAESSLKLDSRAAILVGGDSGPAIVPGKPAESLLIRAIKHVGDLQMPPEGQLSPTEIVALSDWVTAGAPWPGSDLTETLAIRAGRITDADREFWSLQPLNPQEAPKSRSSDWAWNSIDSFLESRQQTAGVTPNPDCSREKLLRRVTLDLTGLLPTIEELDSFLADESSTAFETVVERLLASSAYGERWGRHWLDLVRYADTSGVTSDHPVPQAALYRDYVINSFNQDKPYDQFLREQLAGDLLAAKQVDSPEVYSALVTATGYIAISRRFGFEPNDDQHLTIQDTLDNIGQVMLGLSIGCARCHDHKFDPITAKDYYGLYGFFASTQYPYAGAEYDPKPHGFHPLPVPAEVARHQQVFDAKLAELEHQIAEIVAVKKQLDSAKLPTKDQDEQLATLENKRTMLRDAGAFPVAYAVQDGTPQNARVQRRGEPNKLGDEVPRRFLEVLGGETLPPEHGWRTATFDQPVQLLPDVEYTISVNINSTYASSRDTDLAPFADGSATYRRGVFGNPGHFPAERYQTSYFIDPVLQTTGGPQQQWLYAEQKPIHLKQSDGRAYELGTVFTVSEPTVLLGLRYWKSSGEGGRHTGRLWDSAGQPIAEVRFTDDQGSGRLALADWIASPTNPLTARVMVNRIWQHHFGEGLVRTPNDFGHRGEAPTHPELLDDLARRFISDSWSIKSLHRHILRSHAYRLTSAEQPESAAIDPENRYLWRFHRRRMDAESIRDNLLSLSATLSTGPPGPHPFPPVSTWSFTQHNPFVAVYDHNHRSVYLMQQRVKRHPFFTLFDGPDSNSTTPHRNNTTVPSQSLYFMNSPFVQQQSQLLTDRLIKNHGNDEERLYAAFRMIYARKPSRPEQVAITHFLDNYQSRFSDRAQSSHEQNRTAWIALAKTLLSSNEFIAWE